MSTAAQYGAGYSSAAPTETYLLLRRKDLPAARSPLIICLHGHGASSLIFLPNGNPAIAGPGYHAYQLVEAGYALLSIDDAGVSNWGDAAAMSRIDDAVSFAAGLGFPTAKIGIMGWSMGGIGALNWIKRNPTKIACAWLWAPATDLDFFNATAGYTPSYSTGGVALGAYASEIAADYSPYSTASVGYRVHDEPASFRGIAPIRVAHASDDATIPVGQSSSFVAAVNDAQVSLKTIASGGHDFLFGGATALEVIQHFRASLN